MCTLIHKYRDLKTFTGYKVVMIDKNGDFFSAAMGFKYPLRGKVPIPIKQKKLSNVFNNSILSSSSYGFNHEMINRTTVFKLKIDADNLCSDICALRINNKYRAIVVKMTISKDLMSGLYDRVKVIAGKYICSINEI